jgi:hypothetical protein
MAVLMVATSATAETFVADLEPVEGTGSSGSGSATFVLNDDETEIVYHVTYGGLIGKETASHVHLSTGIEKFNLPDGPVKDGVWVNPGFFWVASLKAGLLYVVIHTTHTATGEIQGFLLTPQTPTEATTWGGIKELYR